MLKNKLLSEFVENLNIQNYSAQTVNSYTSAINSFFNYLTERRVKQVDEDVIRQYLNDCKTDRQYSLSAMKQAYSAIRFLFISVLKKEFPRSLRFTFRREDKLPTVLSVKDVKKIFDATQNLKHKTILMVIYAAGLRISEVLNLKLADLDSRRRTIKISGGKGNKDRLVMMSERLIPQLQAYLEKYHPGVYLFENPNGGKYSPTSIRSFLKKAVRAAGINKRVTPHTFRHSFATHLLEQGTDIRYIQELLGHKKLETTQLYTHLAGKSLIKIKSPLDSL